MIKSLSALTVLFLLIATNVTAGNAMSCYKQFQDCRASCATFFPANWTREVYGCKQGCTIAMGYCKENIGKVLTEYGKDHHMKDFVTPINSHLWDDPGGCSPQAPL
jgi:hypothetical protein